MHLLILQLEVKLLLIPPELDKVIQISLWGKPKMFFSFCPGRHKLWFTSSDQQLKRRHHVGME